MIQSIDSPDSQSVEITINGEVISVAEGTSVLEASRRAGFEIPTLCHLEGQPGFSSCMLCTVEDKKTGKTFASCAIAAAPGMEIETENPMLADKRRTLLELIMSDHSGDCEAPCELVCPASIPIPEIIRHLRNNRPAEAARLLRERVPLGGVLERICTAPCEKGCRRSKVDEGVSIRNICRFAADLPYDYEQAKQDAASAAETTSATLGRVGILGAGPAGLAAAWHLAKAGADVTVVDEHDEAGGMLRYAVPAEKLPRDVLDQEIELVRHAGVRFELGRKIGGDDSFDQWRQGFDAVILCVGQISDPDKLPSNMKTRAPHPSPLHPDKAGERFGLQMAGAGFKIDKATMMTSTEGVFAGGDAARFLRLAVRAVGDGKRVAAAVLQHLRNEPVTGDHSRFNCSMGNLKPDQLAEFAKRGSEEGRFTFHADPAAPLPADDILREAARCMACDCAAKHDCDLREHSDTYAVKANRFKPAVPIPYGPDYTHPDIEHDPGKCIRCAICVRLSAIKQEPVGLAALGRGIQKHPGPPTGKSWADALKKDPLDYSRHCPTGAIAPKLG